jgi:hypothetical protein
MSEQPAVRSIEATPRPNVSRRTTWRRWRIPHVSETARWLLIGVFFLVVVALGTIGFDESMRARGEPGALTDKLYRALQLFVLHSGDVPPPVPWQLEAARLLAPLVDAFAALGAVAALMREQVSGVRVRRYSGHVVVCGLGRLGAMVAPALREAGYRVVAIEADPHSAAIARCREQGVLVLVDDATDLAVLRRAGAHRARYLFAITGDDGRNARIALRARELVAGRGGPPLTCFAHIVDHKLGGVLRQAALAQREAGSLRLEMFNASEIGVPTLLREHPPFDKKGNTPFGPPHIVVVGLGEMGTRLVLHAARRWRAIPGLRRKKLRVTVVDQHAGARVASLKERLPRLADLCDLVDCPMDLESAEFQRADFMGSRRSVPTVTSVYVFLGDDAVSLSVALHLRHRLRNRAIPIVVRTTQEGGVAAFLGDLEHDDAYGDLRVFGLLDLVCRPDVLLGGQNELLARAIHAAYVRGQTQKGQTPETNPSMLDWERLPESLRESNRQEAADVYRKLRAIGCDIEPLTDWDAPPPTFSLEEVELLARMEHDRFVRERREAGWKLGPVKSEARKESPYLVRYGDLPEAIKELDRAAVRDLPALLAEADFAVVRA